jgi:hypothetical protein
MERHADPERHLIRPGLGSESPLEVQGTGHGARRHREHREDAVALPLVRWPVATVSLDGLMGELVVALDRPRHGARVLLPQLGRALDVGEEHRERAGRGGTCRLRFFLRLHRKSFSRS